MVFLFRHGDKLNTGADPELSSVGKRQADALRDLVLSKKLPAPTALVSSPRLRAKQSLLPLGQSFGLEIQENKNLLERQSHENSRDFEKRIAVFISSARDLDSVVYCCSHYDWLDSFMTLAQLDESKLKASSWNWLPFAYLGFSVADETWTIQNSGQVLP